MKVIDNLSGGDSPQVTTVAAERLHSVEDNSGYLLGPMPYNDGVNIKEVYDDASVEYYEEELSILVGDLRRDRGAIERCCNKLSVLLDARDRDNFLQRQEIDRLIGENKELRAHIGALEFEITRLCRELRGGFY
nr:hypothetical protein [Tanacetum cinerariifolium]